jgi:predicted nucleic acid-binding protein
VVEWLTAADENRLFLNVVTLAELRYGAERFTREAKESAVARVDRVRVGQSI